MRWLRCMLLCIDCGALPGLRLTFQQVQRLCGIERTVCQTLLDSLVDAKFLNRDTNGAYTRLTDGGLGHHASPSRRSA